MVKMSHECYIITFSCHFLYEFAFISVYSLKTFAARMMSEYYANIMRM